MSAAGREPAARGRAGQVRRHARDRVEPLLIEPDQGNGLETPSRIMVNKVTTVRRSRLGGQIGTLGDADILRLNRALVVFLGIAASTQPESSR